MLTRVTRLTRGDGTEGGEEGKGEGGKRGEEILACRRTGGRVDQPKVVQEVLADLKRIYASAPVHMDTDT